MQVVAGETFDPPAAESIDEPLVVHQRLHGERAEGLLVFVHGFNGSRYRTWGHLPAYLFRDIPSADVGLYAYRTFISRRPFSASIDLEAEATVLADILRDSQYSRIVLIGHSMGGLLCKLAIKELIDRDDKESMYRLGGLFLLATPQAGSLWIPAVLARFSRDMRALAPHGSVLERAERTFLDRVSPDGGGGKFALRVWALIAAEDVWVSTLSAGLSIPSERRKVVRGSHSIVIKPRSAADDGYIWLRTQLVAALTQPVGGGSEDLAPDHLFGVPRSSEQPVAVRAAWQSLERRTIAGRYQLATCLGLGGTGAAFLARDLRNGRRVCVKVFYAVHHSVAEELRPVIERALRGLTSLSHRHLQTIFDYGVIRTTSGRPAPYVVSRFVDGLPLLSWRPAASSVSPSAEEDVSNWSATELMRTVPWKLELAHKIASALEAAHTTSFVGQSGFEERGVVHGDLTPRNILVEADGSPVVIDFMMPDIQRLVLSPNQFERMWRDDRWRKAEGRYSFRAYGTEIYGTPGFMPPEQAAEGIVTATSDVYTLGLTFACLFFSERVVQLRDERGLVNAWQSGWRPSRHEQGSERMRTCSARLEKLVEQMVVIEPPARLQSMRAVGAAIRAASDDLGMSWPL